MNRDLGSDQAYGNAAGLVSVIPGAIHCRFQGSNLMGMKLLVNSDALPAFSDFETTWLRFRLARNSG